MNDLHEDLLLVPIPTQRILRFLARKTGHRDPVQHLLSLLQLNPDSPPDWHRVLRQGLRHHLHLNLGIPGIEDPPHPIEEHPAALYAALVLQLDPLQVILSGELELAHSEGLLSKKALSKLRKKIRALD